MKFLATLARKHSWPLTFHIFFTNFYCSNMAITFSWCSCLLMDAFLYISSSDAAFFLLLYLGKRYIQAHITWPIALQGDIFLYDQTFLSHQTTESVFPVSCYLQSIQIGRGRYNFVSLKYSINRIIIIVIIVVLETKSNFDTIIKIGQFCNIIFAIRWEVKGLCQRNVRINVISSSKNLFYFWETWGTNGLVGMALYAEPMVVGLNVTAALGARFIAT